MTQNGGNLNVYRASAGSGKTFHLALTYITLLLGYKNESGRYRLFKADDMRRHREILAITFTNKATAEMRSRIIEELNLLANPELKSDYLPYLRSLLGYADTDTAPDNDIRQCARRALDSILFDLGEIQISTIDAFFQRVLRSFAYEADLAGNYELSLEDKQITEQSINELLALACGYRSTVKPKNLNSDVLIRRISDLITKQVMKGEEYKIFNSKSSLRSELVKFVNALSGEDYQTKGSDIETFLAVPNAIENFEEALKRRRSELYDRLLTFISSVRNSAVNEFLYTHFNSALSLIEQGRFSDLTEANFSYFSPDYPAPEKFILAKGKKQFPAESARFLESLSDITEPFSQICTIDTMLANMKYYGLFHEVLKVRQALKVHLNTVMLSDTNTLLNRIIGDDTTPFIYERIGRRLQHFLIDEFQDTSMLQWRNLKPLLIESLSENHENLIIGDVKQCIYRFRNSDPQLLASELERTNDIKNHFNPKSLASNWRSSKTVVEFNNLLFSEAGKVISDIVSNGKADAYLNVRQKAERKNLTGYVNIAINFNEKSGSSIDPIERMVEHIARQLHNGFAPGDITVLVRTNKEGKTIVEELLDAVNAGKLPASTQVLSDEALYVSSAKSVKWLVSTMRQMVQPPQRPETKPGKLPPMTDYDLDFINERILINERNGNVEDPVEAALVEFNELRVNNDFPDSDTSGRLKRASGQSLFEIVETLISQMPVQELLTTEALYLNAFQDLVIDYCRGKSPSLSGFLRLWDDELEAKAAVGLVEGVNAIRVMTIHKSKGLEFKCVHLPLIGGPLDEEKTTRWYEVGNFLASLNLGVDLPKYFPLNAQFRNSGKIPWEQTAFARQIKEYKDDQTIDELNSLYVAFTRAEQELIVTLNSRSQKLEVMTAAGLLWPIIHGNYAQEADSNIIEIGAPAIPKISKNEAKQIINIDTYTVQNRDDMWTHTKVSQQSDSGDF